MTGGGFFKDGGCGFAGDRCTFETARIVVDGNGFKAEIFAGRGWRTVGAVVVAVGDFDAVEVFGELFFFGEELFEVI
ncbi:MAG: hypothetical protein HC860_23120 [Alkalinema sp. RU_4_3]|nr:hypothetical protein [Alkalinema sp. RU_4_3]